MAITTTHNITDYKTNLITNLLRSVEGFIRVPYYDRTRVRRMKCRATISVAHCAE